MSIKFQIEVTLNAVTSIPAAMRLYSVMLSSKIWNQSPFSFTKMSYSNSPANKNGI